MQPPQEGWRWVTGTTPLKFAQANSHLVQAPLGAKEDRASPARRTQGWRKMKDGEHPPPWWSLSAA